MFGSTTAHDEPTAGVIHAVLLAVVFSCGCAHAPIAHDGTVGALEQCSIGSEGIATSKQAKCVARAMGLERGVRPWKVELQNQGEGRASIWSVCNTTRAPHDGEGATGFCWYIRGSDGMLLSKAPWWNIRVE